MAPTRPKRKAAKEAAGASQASAAKAAQQAEGAAEKPQAPDPQAFAANMAKAFERWQQIMHEFAVQHPPKEAVATADPMHISGALMEYTAKLLADPGKLVDTQMGAWQDYMELMRQTTQRLMGEEAKPVIEPRPGDKRFKDEAWKENPVFDFIKQSYLLAARTVQETMQDAEGLSPHNRQKLDFYTRQFVDALSPSNFLMTNPQVLKATLDTNGENLVHGLENLLKDLERGHGMLKISMTDMKAFEVGKNLAVTPGKVIFQNDLMQLIQYEPVTEKVHKTPLLIIPAWINKFYVLDLQPANSVVRWALEQGYTVFMISWVNPDEKHAGKTFDDYMLEGPLAAMDAIEQATGENQVAAVGYCLGGTLLATTLAWLHAKKLSSRVVSATYLAAMVDFREAGELSVFIDEEQLKALEERMSERGYLDGNEMATTFNLLRANDLIWSFVVNNYLLGKDPFPFDLLYWNSDSTRMPARMHSFYLRNMYQKNLLVKPGGITVGGEPIDLRRIATPTYLLASREDHIAPWKSSYAATQLYKGPLRFVLAASGHIAGVVNPPAKNKYCHWVNPKLPPSPDDWFAGAKEYPGSWWPDWEAWQAKLAGPMVKARKVGGGKLKPIENAPGSYVKVKD